MIAVLPLHAHHNATVHQSSELMGHIIKTKTSALLGQAIRGQPSSLALSTSIQFLFED